MQPSHSIHLFPAEPAFELSAGLNVLSDLLQYFQSFVGQLEQLFQNLFIIDCCTSCAKRVQREENPGGLLYQDRALQNLCVAFSMTGEPYVSRQRTMQPPQMFKLYCTETDRVQQ